MNADEMRAWLGAQVDALDRANRAIEVALKPFHDAERALDEARGLLLEPFGGDCWKCAGCDKLLFPLELGFRRWGEDPFVCCVECTPTYGDLQDEIDHQTVDPEDEEEVADVRECIRSHVAAGGSLSDKLPVRPL